MHDGFARHVAMKTNYRIWLSCVFGDRWLSDCVFLRSLSVVDVTARAYVMCRIFCFAHVSYGLARCRLSLVSDRKLLKPVSRALNPVSVDSSRRQILRVDAASACRDEDNRVLLTLYAPCCCVGHDNCASMFACLAMISTADCSSSRCPDLARNHSSRFYVFAMMTKTAEHTWVNCNEKFK